ncbi:protein of unknown function DUF547 [Cynara cardunculus var. scolymus]|uniref:DUF547 domain-containing protein n=1 Tax=Cynara cardunculus var. scolymus TaxID=59895 RepID=A0A103Y506_CYNCS|nr:protein of unknown function DUF547 [Cynara cardunculus var. scolymus]
MNVECSTSSSMAEVGSATGIHKRSKSFLDKSKFEEDGLQPSDRLKLDKGHSENCVNAKKNHLPNAEVQNSLRDEILQLEKKLQDQVCERGALEQALGYGSSVDIANQASIPKPATKLIKEIAVLEYEVSHLEQYLLSLYRKAFDQQISCPSPLRNVQRLKSPLITPRGKYLESCRADISLQANSWQEANGCSGEEEDQLLDSGVQHCHSSYAQTTSGVISLAEHLGTRISDHIPETPNKLSEDMVKCMSAIYCKLANPPLVNHGLSSPTSSSSSTSAFSPTHHSDMIWGPGFRRDSPSFDVQLDNPFMVQGLKESLVSRLEEVHPKKLKHEEKLAFWINVHNALLMHLETAKEEFIRATFGVGKDQRILLPKIVESFGKDSGLCAAGVIEMIQLCLPDTFRKSIKKHQMAKSRKKIEWVPHDFAFRYLISKDLVN